MNQHAAEKLLVTLEALKSEYKSGQCGEFD